MATMVGRCEVGEDNEYASNEMLLGCFGHLCVSRHETPLSRPLTKLSIDTLDTRAASNLVHIYNPNFRLTFNNVSSALTFSCAHITATCLLSPARTCVRSLSICLSGGLSRARARAASLSLSLSLSLACARAPPPLHTPIICQPLQHIQAESHTGVAMVGCGVCGWVGGRGLMCKTVYQRQPPG